MKKYFAKLIYNGSTFTYRFGEDDETIIRRCKGRDVENAYFDTDILTEDLPDMDIVYMREDILNFYLNDPAGEDMFYKDEERERAMNKLRAYAGI